MSFVSNAIGGKEAYIESLWIGKSVTRTAACDPGHDGVYTVVECFWDENGALHCKDNEGYWTPASKLELV